MHRASIQVQDLFFCRVSPRDSASRQSRWEGEQQQLRFSHVRSSSPRASRCFLFCASFPFQFWFVANTLVQLVVDSFLSFFVLHFHHLGMGSLRSFAPGFSCGF